jgi:peptide deformylase
MGTNPIAVCFNPRIVDQGNEEIVLDEGCLSYPGLAVKVKRVKNIKVRYTLPTGETDTQKFTGMTARVFLHELDHMNGVNFINRAGPMAKSMALKKWTKLKRMRNLKKKLGYKA